jgi:tetratricopeptide (TPR) repeat protein
LIDYEARRFPEAARRFEKVLAASPEQHEISFFLGLTRRRLSDDAGALEAFAQVPEDHERWMESRVQTAGIFEKQRDFPRAIAEIEAARAKHPGRPLDLFLASLRGRSGDVDGAVAFLQQFLVAQPDDDELLYQIGVIYGEAKRTDESLQAMQRALEKNPANANALNWIGYTLAERGERLDEAEAMIRRALEIRPDDGFMTDSLGWVHYMRARELKESGRVAESKNELQRAIETLERAATLSNGDPVISEHLGDAWLLRGDRKRALAHYREALALEPRDGEQPLLREKLERLQRELGTP